MTRQRTTARVGRVAVERPDQVPADASQAHRRHRPPLAQCLEPMQHALVRQHQPRRAVAKIPCKLHALPRPERADSPRRPRHQRLDLLGAVQQPDRRHNAGDHGPCIRRTGDVPKCDGPSETIRKRYHTGRNPILRCRQEDRGGLLFDIDTAAERWVVEIPIIHLDRRSTVVELVNHASNVERHPLPGGAVEAVAADRPGAFPLLQLLPGAEPAGVVRHVEHRRVPHRPGPDLLAGGTVHEHRQAPVDRGRQLGAPPGAEDRGGAGVSG